MKGGEKLPDLQMAKVWMTKGTVGVPSGPIAGIAFHLYCTESIPVKMTQGGAGEGRKQSRTLCERQTRGLDAGQ